MVSVTIVTWNSGQYLAECFASLEQQDYRELEVIIVDNASSDETRALLGQVAIFPKRKKLLVEELAFHRDIFDKIAAKHCRCSARPEDVLHTIILATVALFGAAIKVTHVASEINPGGVDDIGPVLLGSGIPAKEFPANTSGARMFFSSSYQPAYEI